MFFLVISGLHVAIFCFFIMGLLAWTGVPVRLRAVLTIALVWLYVLFTGCGVPAVRAGWMISFVLAAPLLERRRDALSGLAGSALLILLYQPQQLFAAGFQLTFVAMWAILCVYPQLAGIFWPWQGFLADSRRPRRSSVFLTRGSGAQLRAALGRHMGHQRADPGVSLQPALLRGPAAQPAGLAAGHAAAAGLLPFVGSLMTSASGRGCWPWRRRS